MRLFASFQIIAVADLNNKDYKKTLKVSWIAKNAGAVPFTANFFDNVISKKVLAPDDDFKNFIRKVRRTLLRYLIVDSPIQT